MNSKLILSASIVASCFTSMASVNAAVTFLGVAAGDASNTDVTVWTRAVDSAAPANTALTLEITADPTFSSGISTAAGTTDATRDFTCKLDVTGLIPNTVYYYRFVEPVSLATSIVGKFKTSPLQAAPAAVHFAFSGDNDGLIRPYALASVIPSQNLDFYINLGDVIYENASNVAGNNGASYLRGQQSGGAAPLLAKHEFETLYVVGDLIDVWQLRRGIYWPQSHNDVIQKLLRAGRKGTRIVYIPGNDDEFVRGFLGRYGSIAVQARAIRTAADGRRLLVIHGHELDTVVQNTKNGSRIPGTSVTKSFGV